MDFLTRQSIVAEIRRRKETDSLKTLLSDIQKILHEQNDAIDKSTKAYEESSKANRELLAKLDLPRADETHHIFQSEHRNPMQWIKLAIEVAMLFIVTAYTTLTAFQLIQTTIAANAAKSAADTSSEQFKLTRQQTVGTMAASVSFGSPEINRDRSQVTLSVGNTGHIIAPIASITISILHQTLEGLKPLSKPEIHHYTLKQIPPSVAPRIWLKTFKLSPVLERDFRNQTDTYTIREEVRFDDGFGNKLTNSFCSTWLGYARVYPVEEHEGFEIVEGFYSCGDEFAERFALVKAHHAVDF